MGTANDDNEFKKRTNEENEFENGRGVGGGHVILRRVLGLVYRLFSLGQQAAET
jgi:hypothetical protein